jgi:hypothetical protein
MRDNSLPAVEGPIWDQELVFLHDLVVLSVARELSHSTPLKRKAWTSERESQRALQEKVRRPGCVK